MSRAWKCSRYARLLRQKAFKPNQILIAAQPDLCPLKRNEAIDRPIDTEEAVSLIYLDNCEFASRSRRTCYLPSCSLNRVHL